MSSAPINTDKATIPIGGGFGKLLCLGRLPVNGQGQAFYNVVKPDAGPDWSTRIQPQLLFPKWAGYAAEADPAAVMPVSGTIPGGLVEAGDNCQPLAQLGLVVGA